MLIFSGKTGYNPTIIDINLGVSYNESIILFLRFLWVLFNGKRLKIKDETGLPLSTKVWRG